MGGKGGGGLTPTQLGMVQNPDDGYFYYQAELDELNKNKPKPAEAPAPAAAAAPPPTPEPEPAAPEPAAPEPPAPVPIDPGGAIDQPTGDQLGGAVLNPPKYWVGGVDSYDKAKSGSKTKGASTTGAITTTQT